MVLIVAGTTILVGYLLHFAYKKGQKSKEKEMAELRRQHRMEQEDEMFAYIQKKTIKHPKSFTKEKVTSVKTKPIEKTIPKDISTAKPKLKKVAILPKDEKINMEYVEPISINEDEFNA